MLGLLRRMDILIAAIHCRLISRAQRLFLILHFLIPY